MNRLDGGIVREPLPSEMGEVDKLTWRDIVEPPDTIMGEAALCALREWDI